MSGFLRDGYPKARKEYTCKLCTCTIRVGEVYYNQQNAYEGTVYIWRECLPCNDSEVARLVSAWMMNPEEGMWWEDAYEWATDAVKAGPGEVQLAAQDYLNRYREAQTNRRNT